MDFSVPLPKLEYEEHGDVRRDYKYADDLINPKNWKDNMSDFAGRINEYIDQRDRFGDVRSKDLREIGLPLGEARKTMDVFQTMSGDILNNRIFIKIGKTVEKHYEHYTPATGVAIPTQPSISIIDVDKLPKEVSDFLMDVSSVGNSLSTGLQQVVSPDKIEYNTKFIKDNDYYGGRVVGENPNLSKYGLYPEVIGTDIARLTGSAEDQTSIAFTSGGLFGWKYVTPQQRTVGSAGDFGSIIIDILFKLLKKNNSDLITDEKITSKPDNNAMFVFKKIKNYYEPIVTSNLIGELAKVNDDVGTNLIDRNPVVLGVKRDKYRQPDIYALWCVYRSIRTPFYNRDKIDVKAADKINFTDMSGFLGYSVERTSSNLDIEFKPKTVTFDESKVKSIKGHILQMLKGDSEGKNTVVTNQSVLLFDIANLVTEFNVPITETTSLAELSVQKDIIEKLEKLNNQAWFNIISQAFTSLYLNLFIAADTDWNNLVTQTGIEGLNVPLDRLGYEVDGHPGGPGTVVNFTGRLNLIKAANAEYEKFRNTLKSYLGINQNNTMGGTSLMGSNPLSLQKYGNIVSYPGDTNILEGISGYMTMLLSDVNSVEERLQQALSNMGNMFWYRDVLRWLEVLFNIFKPNDAPAGRSYSSTEIKARFFQLEKILKILYSRQINLMINYLQKTKVLQKRYETGVQIDKSLEKQIKMTSYYSHSTICYIKRQIIIIYHLLNKSLESWWTTSPNPAVRKRRAIAPAFLEADFRPAYKIMKQSLFNFFRGEVSRLVSSITDPRLIKEVRTLARDLCDDNTNTRLVKKTTSNVYLQDEKITAIRTDARYWLLLVANLKNKDLANISGEVQTLQRLYIPVYTKSGSKRNYFLFDIMPLVLKGNYKEAFGSKSAPQWLSSKDLARTSFPKNNSGIIVIANTPADVAYHNSWQAIAVEWLDNLVSSANELSSRRGNADKKLWFIRTSLYILLHDQQIYNSPALKKATLGSNDTDMTSGGVSRIRLVLQTYQEYTNRNKEENNKYLSLVSREYIKNEMNSSLVQFHSV
jgi:hypothetical protein